MLTIRRDAQIHREQADGYVLRFHFAFKGYQDSAHDGFGALRLFNDDRKLGVLGNRMHAHRDVEVVTYVAEGMFRHEDSLGNGFVLPGGGVECLSAGAGVEHAEHNASATDPLRMILMYFVPDAPSLVPSVTHQAVPVAERTDQWRLVAGPPGDGVPVVIHQQARVYTSALTPGASLRHDVAPGRGAYFYVLGGDARLDDGQIAAEAVSAGDAAMVTGPASFTTVAQAPCDLLLVEVPMVTVSAATDAAIKGNVRVTGDAPT